MNNNKINYLELAKKQFYNLKDEILDEDRHALGAECEEDYKIGGFKFKIKVDGCWEKETWFDWWVYDEQGSLIINGTNFND